MCHPVELNKELAANLAYRVLHEHIEDAAEIVGEGSVNKVFKVVTNARVVIIRMREDYNCLEEYRKEAWCILHASQLGIPGPKVLAAGKLYSGAYMVENFIPGVNGKSRNCESTHIWNTLGRYCSLIHKIKAKGFGLSLIDSENCVFIDSFSPTWNDHINYNVSSLSEDDELIKLNVIGKSQLGTIKKIFQDLQNKKFRFGLNHGDISLKNTIMSEDGTIHLIDWGSAEVHIVPHCDLIELLKSNMLSNSPNDSELQAFLNGYGISSSDFKDMKSDLLSLMVLRAFDKLRWAIDQSPSSIKPFAEYAKLVLSQKLE